MIFSSFFADFWSGATRIADFGTALTENKGKSKFLYVVNHSIWGIEKKSMIHEKLFINLI